MRVLIIVLIYAGRGVILRSKLVKGFRESLIPPRCLATICPRDRPCAGRTSVDKMRSFLAVLKLANFCTNRRPGVVGLREIIGICHLKSYYYIKGR